jgi:hypothetical protein
MTPPRRNMTGDGISGSRLAGIARPANGFPILIPICESALFRKRLAAGYGIRR